MTECRAYPDPVKFYSLPGGHKVHAPNEWQVYNERSKGYVPDPSADP